MLKQGIAMGFLSSVLWGQAAGQLAWGKPADLPANNQIECPDCSDDPVQRKFSLELEVTPKGITLKVEAGLAQPEQAPPIDAVLPAFVEQWLQHAGDALRRPDRSVSLDCLLGKLPYLSWPHAASLLAQETLVRLPQVGDPEKAPLAEKEKQTRQLFEMADLCRRTGVYEAARFFYQRVHLLSPTTRLGRLAIDRLQEIEIRLRDDAEEQGAPGRDGAPESRLRDIRNGSMPLGLVVVTY